MRKVDLHVVLEETLALLAHHTSLQQIRLVRDLQPDLPRIPGSAELLQQVFANVILNACNAMPNGGTLTVGTRTTTSGQVEVWFKDTGCGIPPEDLSRIFDPFYTKMPVGKGVGLGLSICYSILQQHQGAIEASSTVGQGSIFTIRMPTTR